ncbi:MAG: tRNA pseudouridine(38-40) synthase TruA [Spirochaetales bacterium]|nr:tRNA pseudouridine(38-40) synthase TruA [Spirochaetales bacterium]
MRNIMCVIAYDGTDFWGWQVQDEGRTVQGEIEKVLKTMTGENIRVTAAGRTDTGVHSTGQVINFSASMDNIPLDKIPLALNYYLPHDVRVLEAREVDCDFSSRFSATARLYRYYMYESPCSLPHLNRYAWRLIHHPDIRRLNKMASFFRGERDYTTFSNAKDASLSKKRNIHSAVFYYQNSQLVFEIKADSFLYRMVRSIVGSLIEFEKKAYDPYHIDEIIKKEKRELAGTTAPAHGLFLEKVFYD